jgi:hypothetical protein
MGTESAFQPYEVEFIPVERRLAQRRYPFVTANWRQSLYRATGTISADRREVQSRRIDDASTGHGGMPLPSD